MALIMKYIDSISRYIDSHSGKYPPVRGNLLICLTLILVDCDQRPQHGNISMSLLCPLFSPKMAVGLADG